MSRMLFVNLPVQDLAKTTEFFTALGFTFNEQFSDERAVCLMVSDQAYVMLLAQPFFAGFTTKAVADARTLTETLIGVSADSRADVDRLVDRALELGGGTLREPEEEGSMYGRSFYDLDGHGWEVIWMDPAAVA